MAAHTEKQFEEFLGQLKETNATLSFYTDFEKAYSNAYDIAISLNMLNFLIGKKDLRGAVEALWQRDKTAFDVMDILIATRKENNRKFLDKNKEVRSIHSLFENVEGVMEFLTETGLDDVFINSKINDLVDYVFGVEVGLDTNARKNRSGKITENLVKTICKTNNIKFKEQVSSNNYPQISQILGADQKVFDFVISTNKTTYLIEVNFYSGGGSKLNEVERSYSEIAPKINGINGFEFVWITDGVGWKSAKNKLKEAFYIIPRIYNLTTLPEFIKELKDA